MLDPESPGDLVGPSPSGRRPRCGRAWSTFSVAAWVLASAACNGDGEGNVEHGTVDGGTIDATAFDAAISAAFTVRYEFASPERTGCAEGGATLVDAYLNKEGAQTVSLEDQSCTDSALVVPDVLAGTYSVTVVAWDQELWQGTVEAVPHSPESPAEVIVPLSMFSPNP